MREILEFLNEPYKLTDKVSVSLMDVIILVAVLLIATLVLRIIRKLMSRNLPYDDKRKFKVVFGYVRWLIYVAIMLIT
ncbi:MAG: hypothetical protein KDD03_08995, partial [Gelidibacter sp.]|nr:hypothetical protein [Gelidibacter sp.]